MVSYFMRYASPGFLLPVAAKKYQYDQFDFSPFNIFPLNFFLVKYPALMKSAATVSFFFSFAPLPLPLSLLNQCKLKDFTLT